MACLQAAKAAARWAEEIAIPTEASPTATTPVRCQMAERRQPCSATTSACDARDLLLGHARVGLVFEVEHVALARASRARCR